MNSFKLTQKYLLHNTERKKHVSHQKYQKKKNIQQDLKQITNLKNLCSYIEDKKTEMQKKYLLEKTSLNYLVFYDFTTFLVRCFGILSIIFS